MIEKDADLVVCKSSPPTSSVTDSPSRRRNHLRAEPGEAIKRSTAM
jgi:hypothetical protein